MNIGELHTDTNAISTASVFKTAGGNVTSIRILAGGQVKEHITKVPALLICLTGEAIFENENGIKITMMQSDYVTIEPNTKHWINAKSASNLLLIK
jgi:quercetin dioxygenase-like cupin family protein